jgi:hypothetical protein
MEAEELTAAQHHKRMLQGHQKIFEAPTAKYPAFRVCVRLQSEDFRADMRYVKSVSRSLAGK